MASTQILTWERSPAQMQADLRGWSVRVRHAIYQVAQKMAGEITIWMKSNAKWVNRTGNARARLSAWSVQMATGAAIVVAHGVSYGVYLETVKAGSLAILTPAINHFGPIFVQRMQHAIGGRA